MHVDARLLGPDARCVGGLVGLFELVTLYPGTEDDVQRLGHLQAQARVQAVLGLAVGLVVTADVRPRTWIVPWRGVGVEDVDRATGGGEAAGTLPTAVDLLVIATDHQTVIQAEHAEVARDVGVIQVLLTPLGDPGTVAGHTAASDRVDRAQGGGVVGIDGVVDVGVAEVELPIVVQAMVDLGEVLARKPVGIGPSGGQPGVAR
ncbi:hypothetical protein D3C76_795870 [compost metagenome]